jgi:hypothetical protein
MDRLSRRACPDVSNRRDVMSSNLHLFREMRLADPKFGNPVLKARTAS